MGLSAKQKYFRRKKGQPIAKKRLQKRHKRLAARKKQNKLQAKLQRNGNFPTPE